MKRADLLIYNMLIDFLRELPEGFNREELLLSEATDIIIKFMEKHALKDRDDEVD